MSNVKALNEYWVNGINKVLSKLNMETVTPDDFTTLLVNKGNTDKLTITVVCNSKILVLNLDETTKKVTGGWKYF